MYNCGKFHKNNSRTLENTKGPLCATFLCKSETCLRENINLIQIKTFNTENKLDPHKFLGVVFLNCWCSASIFDKNSKVKAIQLKVINYFTSTVCFVTGRLSTFHMARYTSLLFEQS